LEPTVLFVRKNNRYQRIRIPDIQYICAAGSYLEIVTKDRKFSLSQNLSQFVRNNSIPTLMRIHRSYIVNLVWVDSFDSGHVYIEDNIIPIGPGYKEKFLKGLKVL
jgi:two-component system, response regulator PdtaR